MLRFVSWFFDKALFDDDASPMTTWAPHCPLNCIRLQPPLQSRHVAYRWA